MVRRIDGGLVRQVESTVSGVSHCGQHAPNLCSTSAGVLPSTFSTPGLADTIDLVVDYSTRVSKVRSAAMLY